MNVFYMVFEFFLISDIPVITTTILPETVLIMFLSGFKYREQFRFIFFKEIDCPHRNRQLNGSEYSGN